MSDLDSKSTENCSRSPWLMSPGDTLLLVVDLQQRLIPMIHESQRVVWNVERLLDAAALLGVQAWATEQYPQGLGPSVEGVVSRIPQRPSKLMFSCRECVDRWLEEGLALPTKVLLAGIETHICVQQTALDLLSMGLDVYVAADAVGARHVLDHEIALRRMESSGAMVTTTESVLFEWCEIAGTPQFKQISGLVLQTPPGSTGE